MLDVQLESFRRASFRPALSVRVRCSSALSRLACCCMSPMDGELSAGLAPPYACEVLEAATDPALPASAAIINGKGTCMEDSALSAAAEACCCTLAPRHPRAASRPARS